MGESFSPSRPSFGDRTWPISVRKVEWYGPAQVARQFGLMQMVPLLPLTSLTSDLSNRLDLNLDSRGLFRSISTRIRAYFPLDFDSVVSYIWIVRPIRFPNLHRKSLSYGNARKPHPNHHCLNRSFLRVEIGLPLPHRNVLVSYHPRTIKEHMAIIFTFKLNQEKLITQVSKHKRWFQFPKLA